MRKEITLTGRVKGELQYLHTGKMEVLAQGIDFVGNNAQILGYDRKIFSQRLFDCGEKFHSGSLDPVSVDGSFFSVRNRPVGFETAEMINAQRVQDFQLILDTFNPPGESVCLMNLPVVERVAPELSGGRKIIRWYACDSQRISGSIKLE